MRLEKVVRLPHWVSSPDLTTHHKNLSGAVCHVPPRSVHFFIYTLVQISCGLPTTGRHERPWARQPNPPTNGLGRKAR
jgi:hypothetical protein